jgi:hypothetical protein
VRHEARYVRNLAASECIPRATLDLNLMGAAPAIWTKIQSGNTLAKSGITDTARFGIDRF